MAVAAPARPRRSVAEQKIAMTGSKLWARICEVSEISGRFRLRSGLESDIYFDKYQFECDPALLRDVANKMKTLIPSDTEILAGLELGGVPLAAILSLETGLSSVFVRKQAKEYGTMRIAEGPPVAGRKVCIIEDVVTTGGQIMASARDLRKLGATVDHAVCAIWRRSHDDDPLNAESMTLWSAFAPRIGSPSMPSAR